MAAAAARTPATIAKVTGCSFAGARVLVVGLGRFGGGVGVTRWLAEQGAVVTVTDQADRSSLAESVAAIADLPVTLHLGAHAPADLEGVDLAIINPAVVKPKSPFFQAVVERGVAWTTEMNLFCERCPAFVIGVTGTYGKSTTCAMLAEALDACRRAGGVGFTGVHLGGNIGRSLLNDLYSIRSTDWVVLEISNAQLEDLPRIDWTPGAAVVTNLSPHHLDRHGSFEAYVSVKLNIMGDVSRTRRVVAGEMHPEAQARWNEVAGQRGQSVVEVGRSMTETALRVPGRHNRANAACVLAVCRELGLCEEVAREALAGFKGLPHRLEYVRTLDGVDYYNDSKSTSPTATVTAIGSFERPIVAIVGGQNKDVSLAGYDTVLQQACRAVICMGESGPRFASSLRSALPASASAVVHKVERLEQAVPLAKVAARPGDVVLFSPGAPSFDHYPNFVERGKHFVSLVEALL